MNTYPTARLYLSYQSFAMTLRMSTLCLRRKPRPVLSTLRTASSRRLKPSINLESTNYALMAGRRPGPWRAQPAGSPADSLPFPEFTAGSTIAFKVSQDRCPLPSAGGKRNLPIARGLGPNRMCKGGRRIAETFAILALGVTSCISAVRRKAWVYPFCSGASFWLSRRFPATRDAPNRWSYPTQRQAGSSVELQGTPWREFFDRDHLAS